MIKARGTGRVVEMDDGERMAVYVPIFTFIGMYLRYLWRLFWFWVRNIKKTARERAEHKKRPQPPVKRTEFPVDAVRRLHYSAPLFILSGRLVLDVPDNNDPWRKPRRFTGGKVRRPYRIRFGWFTAHQFATLVMGLQLVRSDLIPLVARARWLRGLGFARGPATVRELRAPFERLRVWAARHGVGRRTVTYRR